MKKLIKKIIHKIFNFLGYSIRKLENNHIDDFDTITSMIINDRPIIFDVGANKGQSIERYKKLYPKSKIYSFEPVKEEVDKLSEKYKNDNLVKLNNVAVGERKRKLNFNINTVTGHSSFKKLIPNTTWIKKRSETVNVVSKDYTKTKKKISLITLDNFCKENKIEQIDILKIDTQGYEDKVLEGSIELLKLQKIKLIELELIFSEIYENPLNIYDVEKYLIPNGYKLFGISNAGNLYSDYVYEQNHIYISSDKYDNFKKFKSKFFNN